MTKNLLITAMGLLMASSSLANILQFSNVEMQVYADNHVALAFRCTIAGQDALTELRQKYLVPKEHSDFLLRLCTEREVRKATYDYTCNNSSERVKNKQMIDSLYQDSIDVRLMPYNTSIAGEPICIALRMSKALGVNGNRHDDIQKVGLAVAKRLRKNPNYYYEVLVMDSLRTFLTKEQLTSLLRSKNAVNAVIKARKAWEDVKAAGLIEEEDSTTNCKKAIEYYLQESVINNMFVGHDKTLKSNLTELWKHQPLLVRMNESKKKTDNLEQKKKYDEENDNELAW